VAHTLVVDRYGPITRPWKISTLYYAPLKGGSVENVFAKNKAYTYNIGTVIKDITNFQFPSLRVITNTTFFL
jgi:hypothetical protein